MNLILESFWLLSSYLCYDCTLGVIVTCWRMHFLFRMMNKMLLVILILVFCNEFSLEFITESHLLSKIICASFIYMTAHLLEIIDGWGVSTISTLFVVCFLRPTQITYAVSLQSSIDKSRVFVCSSGCIPDCSSEWVPDHSKWSLNHESTTCFF